MRLISATMMKHALVLAFLAGLFSSPAAAKPTTRGEIDYSALDQVVAAELKEKRTPGAVVAMWLSKCLKLNL